MRLKRIPSARDFGKSVWYVRHQMPLLARMLDDNGYNVNGDQVHNVRIRAAGLTRDELKEKIPLANDQGRAVPISDVAAMPREMNTSPPLPAAAHLDHGARRRDD
jgi:hypothetical protein